MFKGLKSKIAEETKKIQDAVVNQVGEGLHSLQRLGDSAVNNQAGSSNQTSPVMASKTQHKNPSNDLLDPNITEFDSWTNSGNESKFEDGQLVSLEDDSRIIPLRQRSDSNTSLNSIDNFFPALSPASRMAPIPSDTETDVESVVGSSYSTTSASKEQISIVLNKLQGRVVNYKEKYRELAHAYRSLLNENEKVRVVLTASQDKALKRIQELREERKMIDKAKREMEENLRSRILSQDGVAVNLKDQLQKVLEGKPPDENVLKELKVNVPNEKIGVAENTEKIKKLEELLTRCKDTIKSYKEKMQQMTDENQSLNQKLNELKSEQGQSENMSDFVAERAISDYKQQVEKCKEEFDSKLRDETLLFAQYKQEMHGEIEKKETTIEELRNIVRDNEHAQQELKKRLDAELESKKQSEISLEQEKRDLMHELSQAKQAALKIMKEEEEAKRRKMLDEFQALLNDKTKEHDAAIERIKDEHMNALKSKESYFEKILKEREEQTQLALEERDLQKMAALAQHDQKNDLLQTDIETLKTENLELTSKISQLQESQCRKVSVALQRSESQIKEHHESMLNCLKSEYEAKIQSMERDMATKNDLIAELGKSHQSESNDLEKIKCHYEKTMQEVQTRSNQDVEVLKQKIESQQTQLDCVLKEKEELEKSLKLFEQQKLQTEEEIKTLQNLVNLEKSSNDDVASLKSTVQARNEEMEQSKQLQTELNDQISGLLIEMTNLKETNADLEKQVVQLKNLLVIESKAKGTLQNDLNDREMIMADLEQKVESFNQKLIESEKYLEQQKVMLADFDQLKNQNEEKSQLIADLESKLTNLTDSLETRNSENQKITAKYEQLLNSAELLKNDTEKIEKLEHQISTLNGKASENINVITSLEEKLSNAENKHQIYKTEHENKVTELRNEINLNLNQIGQMENEATSLKGKCEHLEKEKLRWQEERSELKTEVASVSSCVQALNGEMEQLRLEISRKKKELSKSTKKSDSLSVELEKCRNFEQLLNSTRQDLQKSQELAESLQKSSSKLEHDLQNQSFEAAQRETLEAELENLKTELSSKDSQCQTVLKEKSSLDDKLSLLKKKYESILKDLRHEITTKTDEIFRLEKLNETIAEKDETIATLNSKLNKMSDLETLTQNRRQEMDNLNRNLQTLQDKLTEKESETVVLVEKQQKAENDLKLSIDEVQRLNLDISNLKNKQEVALQQSQVSQDQANLASQGALKRLEERLQEAQDQNELLERQLIERQIAVEEAQGEKVALEDRQTVSQRKLENALKTVQSENRKLNETIKDLHEKMPAHLSNNNHSQNDGPVQLQKFHSIALDNSQNVVFNEPTEAEYLRNIVFRYMVERENLGKESVNLAKAIAAVLKLTFDQTREVVEKEEARALHWFPSLHKA